jgi:hypothetical protein
MEPIVELIVFLFVLLGSLAIVLLVGTAIVYLFISIAYLLFKLIRFLIRIYE